MKLMKIEATLQDVRLVLARRRDVPSLELRSDAGGWLAAVRSELALASAGALLGRKDVRSHLLEIAALAIRGAAAMEEQEAHLEALGGALAECLRTKRLDLAGVVGG